MAIFDFDETDVSFYYDLVDYWIKEADTFVLIAPFFPYGLDYEPEYGLSEEESEEALSDVYKELLRRSENAWCYISEKERKRLPCFEEFLKMIEKERDEIVSSSKNDNEIITKYGKILYSDISGGLFRIYSNQKYYAEIKFKHSKLKKQTEYRDKMLELKSPENALLLKNHIGYKLSHSWYGTWYTSTLAIIHRFKCNDETERWLKSKNGFHDLKPFEDLAFYKGDECVMGSCVHEGLIL